jgi:nucleoprotein TPR
LRNEYAVILLLQTDPCSDSQKAPILAQQRVEYERLQSESAQLASQLADALAERDSSVSTATDVSQRLTKTNRENEFLQKQLNDLGRQVQILLKEIARRQDPAIPSELARRAAQVPFEEAGLQRVFSDMATGGMSV